MTCATGGYAVWTRLAAPKCFRENLSYTLAITGWDCIKKVQDATFFIHVATLMYASKVNEYPRPINVGGMITVLI
ncbi:hypothetical protein PoB_000037900 [Plakobranchus ocellatus]|uniref:Uncharacterized protein n=1 Tax=Plakobranchus ocellatus TaxID=259542 RepID=A0AAV3XRF4_9GAST|nr:hypothetical protein PoB_000037900 [Plakobranchus ocellatus]